jgi:toxin ParE1/3/4
MRVTFSRRAKADIREIWNYTVEHWGTLKAEIYLGLIEAATRSIATNPRSGRSCDDIRPAHRKYLVGSHVFFYRMKANAIFVVRILHQRMDFDRHL